MPIKFELSNTIGDIANNAYYAGQGTNAYGLQQSITQTQINAASSGGANFGNLFALNGGFGPGPGKAVQIHGFMIYSTKQSTFFIRVGVATTPISGVNIPEYNLPAIVGVDSNGKGQVAQIIPCNWVLRNGQSIIPYITKILNGTETTACYYPIIDTITDDFNVNARYYMAWIGTSITNGSGPTGTAYMYHFLFASELRKRGKSIKNELYGISGSTTASHNSKCLKGEYDVMPNKEAPGIVIIELAVNDASAGVAVSTSVARMRAYAERMLNHPENAKLRLIILGGTPLENTTAWNNLLLLDTAYQALVDELAETYVNRVFFIKLSDAFTRTDATKYASSDTAGSRIHPSDAGCADIFEDKLLPWLDGEDGEIFLNSLPS